MDTRLSQWLLGLHKSAAYNYSTCQVTVPEGVLRNTILAQVATIPENILHVDPDGGTGRETDPHVTVRYGLLDSTPERVLHAVENTGPIHVALGPISKFATNPLFDVLKVDVDSPDLHRLNALVDANVPYESEFHEYHPHLTLAYVRKGKGREHDGTDPFHGMEFTATSVEFRDKDENRTSISTLDPLRLKEYLKDELVRLHRKMVHPGMPASYPGR